MEFLSPHPSSPCLEHQRLNLREVEMPRFSIDHLNSFSSLLHNCLVVVGWILAGGAVVLVIFVYLHNIFGHNVDSYLNIFLY